MASLNHVGREGLMDKLKELGIETTTVEHPEACTIEALLPHVGHLPGALAKNLFMRDKKKRGLWLVAARHDHVVDLHDMQQRLKSKGCLRLADESVLHEMLGLRMGSVTPFGLINDRDIKVTFILDDDLINGGHEKLYFHPMDNTATTSITPTDLIKFLEVFTIETMMEHVGHLPGMVAKNLFVRDKKKKGHWLVSARHDRPIDLNAMGKKLEAKGGLRLADESVLIEKLGVKQGCVTPFALLNDPGKQVTFVVDNDLLNGGHERLFFHPMTNAATSSITPDDLKKFLDAIDHTPVPLIFDS